MPYIYKITNKINNKVYIGKTLKTIEERWREHISDYSKIRNEKRPLYDAMNKYGIENFTIEEIEKCSVDVVNEREKYWIQYYNSYIGFEDSKGYNATLGGDGKHYINYEEVCLLYEKYQNKTQVANILNIDLGTVSKILKLYDIKTKSVKEILTEKYGKQVEMYDLNKNYLQTFPSVNAAARYMVENKLTNCKQTTIKTHITEVCVGKRKTAAKFIWKYPN